MRIIRLFLSALATSVIALYLACLAYLFLDQRHLTFHPYPAYAPPNDSNAGRGMREFPVETDDGLALKGWYRPATTAKLTILFFHGNADGLLTAAPVARPYVRAGYGFLIAEYRGYSKFPGSPSEDGFYRDARAYLRALNAEGVPYDRIVLFGHSLGTGVATQMATEFPVRGLALLSPFLSIGKIAQLRYPIFPADLLTTDRFDSEAKIDRIHCPLLIGHGLLDVIVPESQGQALYDLAPAPKRFALFPRDNHINAFNDFAAVALPWLDGLGR